MPDFGIAEFGTLMFALALFIFFWAAQPLIVAVGMGLASILRGFPAIGDDIADWIMARTRDVEHVMQQTLEDWVHVATLPFVDLMNGWANNSRWDSYYQRIVMGNIVGVLAHVSHAQQYQVTQPVVNTINTTVAGNTENTNNYITQVVGVNQQYVDDSYTQLASWANDAIQSVYQDTVAADTAIDALGSWTEGQFNAANTYAETVSSQARDDAVTTANDYTQTSFTTLETYVSQTVDWVQSTIAANQEWTAGTVNKGIDDVTAIAAGLTTLVMENVVPRVVDIEQDIEKCLRPMCEAGPGFMKGLSSLLGLLGSVELGFALVQLVTDPEGSARTITSEAEELIDTPLSVVNGLFGTNFSLRG